MSKNTALSPSQSRFRIGDALVQPDRLVVCVDGIDHAIEPRVMDVLLMLAENAGETVSTYQFLADLWEDTNCGDNPVHKAITCLRGVFGDSPRESRYIETIRKRGYRLIAPVVYPGDYRRIPLKTGDWKGGSPFVGLSAFDSAHTSVFCGRSRTKVELLGAMRRQIDLQHRFVLVVGASGCGKTSLLQAGALPMLQRKGGFDGLETLSHAHCDLAGVEPADAAGVLAGALAQWRWGNREVFPPMPASDLAAHLKARPESVSGSIQEAFRRHPVRDLAERPHAHLLLCIDHAESLVSGQSQDAESIRAFDSLLHCLCEAPRTLVVMIVRGDFYLKLVEALPGIAERKGGDGHVDVLTPRPGEIAEIVRTPAALAGLAYERDEDTTLHLDDVLRDAAVAQPDALPLLQHTLQALYERRDGAGQLLFSAYHAIGGLEGALAHRAEEVFATLPENAQRSLDAVLSLMVVVQPENDSISARRVVLSALGDDARRLAETFVRARLFVAELDGGAPIVRVAHEALLRQWPRARDWAQDNRRILQARVRLQRAAARWVEEGKRDDHLLNPGRPLGEALEVVATHPEDVGTPEHDFVQRSRRSFARTKMAKRLAIASLVLFAAVATTLAIVAERAQESESHRRMEAQRLAEFMLNNISKEVEKQGNLNLLDNINTEAINYLRQRNAENLNEEELINLSQALIGIGKNAISRGNLSIAFSALQPAYDVARRGVSKHKKSIKSLNQLGQASYWIGLYSQKKMNYEMAKKYWSEYDMTSSALMEMDPENKNWTMEKSYSTNNLGKIQFELGNFNEAKQLFQQSKSLKESIMATTPPTNDAIKELIDTNTWIASCDEYLGNLTTASNENSIQIAKLRELILKEPTANTWKRMLANALIRSAILRMSMNERFLAERDVKEANEIFYKLVKIEPENYTWKRDMAFALMTTSDLYLISHKKKEAQEILSAAEIIMEELVGTHKNIANEWRRLLAEIRIKHAIRAQQKLANNRTIAASLAVLADSYRQNPKHEQTRLAYAEALISIGALTTKENEERQATENFAIAASILRSSPKSPRASTSRTALFFLQGEKQKAFALAARMKSHGYLCPLPPEIGQIINSEYGYCRPDRRQ